MAIVVARCAPRADTYDALDTTTGEVATGRITPADRATMHTFLRRWAGEQVEAAVEATTGWRFVRSRRGWSAVESAARRPGVARRGGGVDVPRGQVAGGRGRVVVA